jgi:hypothetical protein
MPDIDPHEFPLASYLLGTYLSKCDDETNFPQQEIPAILGRYETLFTSALNALSLTKQQLKARSEFNFDSSDAANLEGGVAILRVTEALRLRGFVDLTLVKPRKGKQGADLTARIKDILVCVEVKAVTKQSVVATTSFSKGSSMRRSGCMPRKPRASWLLQQTC